MAIPAATRPKIPIAPLTVGVVVVVLVIGVLYFLTPARTPSESGPASADAKAYLMSLGLSDVTMKATENFMQQQIVEIEGKISNNGPRQIASVDVYCVFRDVERHEIYRERAEIVRANKTPFKPGETRAFRLAFDHLPEAWNQAMPALVIAKITFAG